VSCFAKGATWNPSDSSMAVTSRSRRAINARRRSPDATSTANFVRAVRLAGIKPPAADGRSRGAHCMRRALPADSTCPSGDHPRSAARHGQPHQTSGSATGVPDRLDSSRSSRSAPRPAPVAAAAAKPVRIGRARVAPSPPGTGSAHARGTPSSRTASSGASCRTERGRVRTAPTEVDWLERNHERPGTPGTSSVADPVGSWRRTPGRSRSECSRTERWFRGRGAPSPGCGSERSNTDVRHARHQAIHRKCRPESPP
jgi:hypothetical protein